MSVSAIMETSGPVQLKLHFYFTNKQQTDSVIDWFIQVYAYVYLLIYLLDCDEQMSFPPHLKLLKDAIYMH